YKGNELTGKITNRSSYDFHRITLVSGMDSYSIGSLKAGETKSVSLTAGKGTLFRAPTPGTMMSMFQQGWSPNPTAQDRTKQKRSQMIETAVRREAFDYDSPVLFAFTEAPLYPVKVNGDKSDQNSLSLFLQPVSIHLAKGSNVSFNTAVKTPKLVAVKGRIRFNPIRDGGDSFGATKGTYDLMYHLPKSLTDHSYTLKSITLQLSSQSHVGFQIYNATTSKFEKLGDDVVFEFNKHPEKYVDKGTIRIRVKKSQDKGGHVNKSIQIPRVNIKGVTKHD
ncbi:MAG TPA: hypothetical protein VFK33_17460, partial [Bacillales bacterium]|nr:hypothetical protein [Bacillales bacterium]